MHQWLSFGLDDDAFWRKSPRQIVAVLKGREAGLIRDHNDRAWSAYITAMLPRMKRPPTLRKLQVRDSAARRPRQSWQDMKAVARMITLMHGGEVSPKAMDGRVKPGHDDVN
ncbi:hypothetical protein [Bradyrhizobium sp. SZCCHNS3002]|uniref:hypothetical protein n=1 Tax=Bradyrhizobium sp. SZCCHNS3002 TaxID=3057310 RepID=UPI0028E7E0F6|nr:hypothetical protein [Bradyrhizobium sp. SZCCHNS3002]